MKTCQRILPMTALTLALSACIAARPNETKRDTTIQWQGYTWIVKSSKSEGPGPNQWDPKNVWIDEKGFLHMKISKVKDQWSCAEIWTTKPLEFGTYQCQVEGAIDTLDPNLIFSMFSYQGPDNIKEIDIEYAKWGNPKEKNGWWTVYPNDTAGKKGFTGFDFKLHGTYTTSRFAWTKEGVHYWMLGGHQPIDSTSNLMQEWNYRPATPEHYITQTPMPLHFNLWLFQGKPPTDGKPVEMVIHSFSKS